MGLFDVFSSKSKTKNETTNVQNTRESTLASSDNRSTVTGNIGGNVSTGQTGGDVIVRSTDFGALDNANQLSLAALDFGADSIEGAQGVASDALMSNEAVAGQAIDLSGDSIRESLDFGRDAIDTLEFNSGQAFGFGEQLFDGALGAILEGQSGALDLGSDTLGAIEEVNRNTIDTLSDSFEFFNQQTSQNVDRSLAFADRANRSEGAAVLESGLKTVAWVGGIIGGTIVLRELVK